MLVECTAELDGVHLTVESFAGLATVRLSTRSAQFPDRLRPTVFHETGHAFLSCGVRMLDEGWAHFFADRFCDEAIGQLDAKIPFTLRALLSQAASKGMFFEDIGASPQQAAAIAVLGRRLVATVFERGGGPGLVGLFMRLEQAVGDPEVCRLVEEAIGMPLARFHVCEDEAGQHADLVEATRRASFEAYRLEQPALYDPIIEQLSASNTGSDPALLDALIGARIARAVLALNTGGAVAPNELAAIDMLIKDAVILPEARLWTLRGHRAVLALKLEKANFIKASTYSKKAVAAYEAALKSHPEDCDLVIGRALLYVNTPAQYGGDLGRGLNMIRELTTDPRYGEHAHDILQRLGASAPRPRQDAEQEAEQEKRLPPAASAAAAPVIVASGLRSALSATFTLDVPELLVRKGERVALVGRNGSGKSALLETLIGLRTRDAGEVALLDSALGLHDAVERNRAIGMSLQKVGLFSSMYVREIVRVHKTVYRHASTEVFDTLGIGELMALQYKVLSRGQVQRVQLYLALAHQPALVLLDEPTLGLDEWFANALRALWKASDATIVLISHAAADIECMQRILVMDGGRIVDAGTLDALADKHVGQFRMKVLQELPPQAADELLGLPELKPEPQRGKAAWTLFGSQATANAFRGFVAKHALVSYAIERVGTEDLLSHITRQPG